MAIFRGTGGQGDSTTDTTVTTVTQKAAEAASSATSAANSATSASNSATSAETSATNAATSESNAATSATNASTSATAAETAKTAAQAAQTAAETAETNAETAEANAVTAKTQAESARDNAQTAQTAAETAETNAETAYANTLAIYGSTTDVQNAVDSASASATTATTKASEAATSATNAANSATSAGTSETNAASSASSAATSAASANSYATDAQTAQTAAETAQAAAEAAEASINGLYLGSLADDPTLDGNGVAVTTGDLYFNTTAQEVRVYTDGDVWEPVVDLAGDITVNSLTSNNDVVVKGNLQVQGTTITVDSATAQTIDLGDNDRIRLGDSDDLQIYHDGNHSRIDDTGTGNLILRASSDLYLGNLSGEVYIRATENGAVQLRYDNSAKLATTSTGVDVTGTLVSDGATIDGDLNITFNNDLKISRLGSSSNGVYWDRSGTQDAAIKVQSNEHLTIDNNFSNPITFRTGAVSSEVERFSIRGDGDLYLGYEDTGTTAKLTWDASAEELQFKDNVKAEFGDSGDFELYSDGTNGIIKSSATQEYRAVTHSFESATGGTTRAVIDSTGIDVTGTVTADGLTVNGQIATIQDALSPRLIIMDTTNNYRSEIRSINGDTLIRADPSNAVASSSMRLSVDDKTFQKLDSSGDISFYDDSGTSQDFYWDASTSRLGLGTTTPSYVLDVRGSGAVAKFGSGGVSADGYINFNSRGFVGYNGSTGATTIQSGSDKAIDLRRSGDFGSGTRAMLINANGDVSLYADDGSSQDLYWDASTSRLGLGTTTPSGVIHAVSSGVSNFVFQGSDVGEGTLFKIRNGTNNSATGNGHRLEFVHGNNDSRNVFFRTSSTGTFGRSPDLYIGSQNDSGGAELDHVRIHAGGDVSFYNNDSTSQDFYWDASTSRLGLGTTSPGADIHVSKAVPNIRWADSNASGVNQIYQSGSSFVLDADPTNADANSRIIFKVDNSEQMRLDSNGRLGIGTTSPDTPLHVNGTTLKVSGSSTGFTEGALLLQNDGIAGFRGNGTYMYDAGTDKEWYTGTPYSSNDQYIIARQTSVADGSQGQSTAQTTHALLTVNSSGNVGIGTTSPLAPLQVHYTSATPSTSAGDAGLVLRGSTSLRTLFGSDTASPYGGWIQNTNDAGTGTYPILLNPQGGGVSIGTRGSTSGSLDITNGSDTSIIQRINGADATSEYIAFGVLSDTAKITAGNAGGGSTNLTFEVSNSGTESEAMRIDSSGNVGIGTSSPSGRLDLFGPHARQVFRIDESTSGYTYTQGLDNTGVYFSSNSLFRGFRWSNGGSERMRLDSSGNVGIGTTSPDGKLHIDGASSSTTGLVFEAGNEGNNRIIDFQNTSGAMRFGFQYDNSNVKLSLVDSGRNETVTFDSLGRVGLGTTSPLGKLDVNGGGDAYVRFFDNQSRGIQINQADPILSLRDSDASGTPLCDISGSGGVLSLRADASNETASSAIQFTVDGSEAARIDSSGNLLVGRTATWDFPTASTTGIGAQSDGTLFASRNSGASGYFRRNTNDGDIVEFWKDTFKVGSIASYFGSVIIGDADTALRFNDAQNTITPRHVNGGNVDNTIDLGSSVDRFKDLYLSGGVYLGGTGSANLLDDYEEGDWTPTLAFGGASTGITYSQNDGRYTKIGNQVTVHGIINLSSKGTATGTASIASLPFAVGSYLDGTSVEAGGVVPYFSNFAFSTNGIVLNANDGTSNLLMRFSTAGSGAAPGLINNSHFNNDSTFRFSITYFT